MHELPITQNMVEIVLRHAKEAEVSLVTEIHLTLGVFSNYVGESIQFYFDILSQGTVAEGASLHFRRVPMTTYCWDCGQNFEWGEETLPTECVHCQGTHLQFAGGDECTVESIVAEKP